MPRTRCDVRFAADRGEAAWTDRGLDEAEFFISPNAGEELRPLARIASGGELSRIMLALKTLASIDAPGKTLIFDEVDAGIGGAVADVVGGTASEARRSRAGAVHHAPAADRGARGHALPHQQGGEGWADRDRGRAGSTAPSEKRSSRE